MTEEQRVRVTLKGYEQIWAWMRLTSQLCEMEHKGNCEDMTHETAFMLALVLPTPEQVKAEGWFE